ncbi:outer membrane protein assembly factor BamB family protein [Rhodococcus pyridinivorans]
MLAAVGGVLIFGSGENDRRVDGQLRYTFPTQPVAGWTLYAQDVIPGSDFVAPDSLMSSYRTTGINDLGEVWLTAVRSGNERQTHLAAVEPEDGSVRWTVPIDGEATCATQAVDGMVPCVLSHGTGRGDVAFFRLSDGSIEITHEVGNVSMVEVVDGTVYTIGSPGPSDESLTKGTPRNLSETWQAFAEDNTECTSSGDGRDFRIGPDIVAFDQVGGVAVEQDTGAQIGAGLRNVTSLPGQGYVGTECTIGDGLFESTMVYTNSSGTEVFRVREEFAADPWLALPDPARPIVSNKGAYDPETGATLWKLDDEESFLRSIIGEVVLGSDDGAAAGYDIMTGAQLWRAPFENVGGFRRSVSDGERLLVLTEDQDIVSVHLATGDVEWSTQRISEKGIGIQPADDGFVTTSQTSLTYYPPTGDVAGPPGLLPRGDRSSDAAVQGETGFVTKCGSAPQMRPVSYRTTSGSLVVSMEMTATCPGGDILSTDAMRISVSDTGGSIASGVFDFSAQPMLLPRNDSSGPSRSVTREFEFQSSSFWRLPNSLGTESGSAAVSAAGNQLVECENIGTDNGPDRVEYSDTSAPATTTVVAVRAAEPVGGNVETTSLDALVAQADADRPYVTSDLANRWVAQISAKRIGLDAVDIDGTPVHWTAEEILRQHLELRLKYPEVRLARSEEWRTFDLDGWWVTFAGVTFDSADAANAWCDARNIAKDQCFAKLVSNDRSSEGTTRYRR